MTNYIEYSRIYKANLNLMKTANAHKTVPRNFKFAVDIRNSTKLEINKAISNIIKQTDNLDDYIKVMYSSTKIIRAWVIKTEDYVVDNYGHKNNVITFDWLESIYDDVLSSNMGVDENNIITIKEFLDVGLEGVKKLIEMKNKAKKYNLI